MRSNWKRTSTYMFIQAGMWAITIPVLAWLGTHGHPDLLQQPIAGPIVGAPVALIMGYMMRITDD